MSSQQAETILEALSKKYEKRTYLEHKTLTATLAPFFPTLSSKHVKLLTFFLELRLPPSEILPENHTPNSIVLTLSTAANPELPIIAMHKLIKNAIAVPTAGFAMLLDYQKYLGADRLGESSVEKEVAFWESSEYFCSMPRGRFYEVMRVARVMTFVEGQSVYTQGQLLTEKESGSGIYVIRRGEFGCYRQEGSKDVEASHYDAGHLFGALELINGRSKQRATTIRCKSAEAVVYHFSEEIFNHHLRQYCEKVVAGKQAKLMRFVVPGLMEKSKSLSFSHSLQQPKILHSDTMGSLPFRSTATQAEREMQEKEFRAFPALRLEQIRQTTATSFFKNTMRESERIEAEGLRRTTYLSLKKEGPLKNYPLPAQRSNFPSSEFRDLDRLLADRKALPNPSLEIGIGRTDQGVWKRDMISSFYRQSVYGSLWRQPE